MKWSCGGSNRAAVTRDRLPEFAGALEQVRAHRVDAVAAREPRVGGDGLEPRQPRCRPVHHRQRDALAERDHRVVLHREENAVRAVSPA